MSTSEYSDLDESFQLWIDAANRLRDLVKAS